jgi:diadenosine tetraphosphate (Ap4A) HIT family hydrolase
MKNEAKWLLDLRLGPNPDGYNVGFNAGAASGQTVPHGHIHFIPDLFRLTPSH